jgi:hypothetical protein
VTCTFEPHNRSSQHATGRRIGESALHQRVATAAAGNRISVPVQFKRRGWTTGYLHPAIKRTVVRAGPAEVKPLRALHHVPRGQRNRRPWLKTQAALTGTEQEEARSHASQPRL